MTESLLKPFGLSRFQCRPGVASSALTSSARALVSDPYRIGRFWKDKDDVLEGLEENARRIYPTHWKRRSVLFFWTVRVFVLLIAGFAGFYPRTDRSSLLRSRNGAGMGLFRRTTPVAPNEAGFQGGHDSLGSLMRPSRGEEFLQTP